MEHRLLGRTGCAVSVLGLGTMTFGRETRPEDAHLQLDRFVEAGGDLVDTADVYADQRSEAIIGDWLASRPADVRAQVIVATKGRFSTHPGPNGLGSSRRHLAMALEASLRRLRTDAIDLYQLHAWDPLTPLEETMGFLDDAVRKGQIRYVGLSNFTAWQLQRAVDLADFTGLARPVALQTQYSLLVRQIEWEIVPACQQAGVGMLIWSPLAAGWLTGKYRRDQAPAPQTRLAEDREPGPESYERRGHLEQVWEVVDALREVADGHGCRMAHAAIAWLVGRRAVTSVIIGARTLGQLDDNLAAAAIELGPEERARLDAVSAPVPDEYPYGDYGSKQRDRIL